MGEQEGERGRVRQMERERGGEAGGQRREWEERDVGRKSELIGEWRKREARKRREREESEELGGERDRKRMGNEGENRGGGERNASHTNIPTCTTMPTNATMPTCITLLIYDYIKLYYYADV